MLLVSDVAFLRHYTQQLRNADAELVAINASLVHKRQEYNQRQASIEQIKVCSVGFVRLTKIDHSDRGNYK